MLTASVLGLAAAGCAGSAHHAARPAPAHAAGVADGERVIRAWSAALNAGRYERAASLFAAGAVVQQGGAVRMSHAQLVRFNASLPCRGDVTSVVRVHGGTLATFRLREGRHGDCREGGLAEVRFVIRGGLIREWRQLPNAPLRPGAAA